MDQIRILEREIEQLRTKLQEKENELYLLKQSYNLSENRTEQNGDDQHNDETQRSKTGMLPKWAIERYSRQILLREIGVPGQLKICSAKVLIVGAGGLGCPAAMYLAGAGVGEIGIVDYDSIEITNIHRQLLHKEQNTNMNKAESAAEAIRSINSRITVTPYKVQLNSSNAMDIASKYDLVLDCTDNAPTRYLLSDLCVLAKLPLISGSALKLEGQLTIYCYRSDSHSAENGTTYRGPCYRCVFATPPSPDAMGSCSQHGVAGPVPGVIGTLQAMEALKLIIGHPSRSLLVERMLIMDVDDMSCKVVQLRPRNAMCAICSDSPTITQLVDYEAFCKTLAKEKVLEVSTWLHRPCSQTQSACDHGLCNQVETSSTYKKQQDSRQKTERRKQETQRRMIGKSYYGFRIETEGSKKKYIQDVLKSERKIGPPCKSELCSKNISRFCSKLSEDDRQIIFNNFWKLPWNEKRNFVKSLIDKVPAKRRRTSHKGVISRKGDSKNYNLLFNGNKLPVCRVTFLNTLGLKEAMVRCWLVSENKPKSIKTPLKSLNVISYVDSLPKIDPKCQFCINNNINIKYININVKSQYQLYSIYVKNMKSEGRTAASRKTFAKILNRKNLRIFKPKNEKDICDLELNLKILPPNNRITALELSKLLKEGAPLVFDVRVSAEFDMCHINGASNYPIDQVDTKIQELVEKIVENTGPAVFICRRGNDSQIAAKMLLEKVPEEHRSKVKDMVGGLHAWAHDVDKTFPVY